MDRFVRCFNVYTTIYPFTQIEKRRVSGVNTRRKRKRRGKRMRIRREGNVRGRYTDIFVPKSVSSPNHSSRLPRNWRKREEHRK